MKLVAVGMRYQKNIEHLLKNLKDPACIKDVKLQVEANDSGVDGKAVAVYYSAVKIAYIRNTDIMAAINWLNTINNEYVAVTKVTPNYLIVETFTKQLNINDIIYCKPNSISNPAVSNSTIANNVSNITIAATNCANTTISTVKEPKMNTNSMRDSFFREVKNVAIDIQSGKFGVISQDGISVYDAGMVNVNPIQELGVKVPAFAVRVAVDQLAEGDIILSGNDATFFKQKTEQGYEVVTLAGEVKQVGQVSNMFFGKNTVLAVKNMFGNGGAMNPMMLAMFMSDDFAKGDNKNLMLAMAMSGGFGGASEGMNPLMLAMLMK